MKNKVLFLTLGIVLANSVSVYSQSRNLLWYNRPANFFEESFVLGNGKMGASVFGGVYTEKIYLNDATLWSGEPEDPNMYPDAYKNIPKVREALRNHDYKVADSLNKINHGVFSESFAPLGTLLIQSKHKGTYEKYYRELDFSQAVSKVDYRIDGASFHREYFVSHPDQVMIIELTSDKKKAINCSIGFESLLKYKITPEKNRIRIDGYAPYHAVPSYMGDVPNAVLSDENRGTRFTAIIDAKTIEGEISCTNSTLELSGCSSVVLTISVETSFNGYDKNPATEGKNNQAIVLQNLNRAVQKPLAQLRNNHIADYQTYYDRLTLDLGATTAPDLPTDKRLKRYAEGKEDKNLEILYFQYGRYLLISSSRTEGVPANLQGIWNPYLRPPWSSNFTLNINAEENYWMAETANLSEMHTPLLTFIEGIAETGKITAQNFYGTRGWAACHNSDIWAMSNQVDDFGNNAPNTVVWNLGGVWLSTHLWEHFQFTRDTSFLQSKAYPLMKGAAQFCLDWMVQDENGRWITSPCTSPENLYLTPEGYAGATSFGCTADVAMIRELFEGILGAAKVLKIDDEFTQRIKQVHQNLLPYKIGKKGNLQEWYFDWEDYDPKHRHQSHLFGLYPGHQITPINTPDLARACRTSLDMKGDETTGWSKGWRINLWARLQDGNRAYKMYRELLRYVDPNGLTTMYDGGGGTYPNLLDAHPPFQIDGNFGGAAAVIEMLVQSTDSTINLLPALPDTWSEGSVNGIRARGGFEISMKWEDGTLMQTTIHALAGGQTTLMYKDKKQTIDLKKGKQKVMEWQ